MASANMDAELGLPLFLRHVLPVGVMGLMMSAYFSAIMSTADSCLMAASGNLITDVLAPYFPNIDDNLRVSQCITLIIGALSILLALNMQEVLSLMLHSYAFMVSGLLIPVLMMLTLKKPASKAAMVAMVSGGSTTLIITFTNYALPAGLDPIFAGILISLLGFVLTQKLLNKA